MSDSNREKVTQQLEEITQDERRFLGDNLKKNAHKPGRSWTYRDSRKMIRSHPEKLTQDERILLVNSLNKLFHRPVRGLNFRGDHLKLIKSHREEIFQLATKYGVSNIKVFVNDQGNNENGDNEVDFLVDLAEDRSLLDLGGLLMDLRELLGFDVFVFTEKTIKDIYLDRILQEALPL